MKKFGQIIKYLGIYFVSFTLIEFAVSKFLNAQFQITNYAEYTPLKDLALFWHAWSFLGRSYNYNFFLGLAEITAGILILFNRTRLIGLLIAIGIYANILVVDIEFHVYNAILHAAIEFIIILLLMIPYMKDLKKFFWDKAGRLESEPGAANKFLNLILPVSFIIIASALGVITIQNLTSSTEKITGAYKITEMVIKGDTVELGQGKFTKDPMLFFEFDQNSILSINDNSYWGIYRVKSDSVIIDLDKGIRIFKTIRATVDKDFKVIKGSTDRNDPIEIKISRIERVKD